MLRSCNTRFDTKETATIHHTSMHIIGVYHLMKHNDYKKENFLKENAIIANLPDPQTLHVANVPKKSTGKPKRIGRR